MAPTDQPAVAAAEDEQPTSIKDEQPASSKDELCNALYASCATHPHDKVFFQDELLATNVIPNRDLGLLSECLNILVRKSLFKLMQQNQRVCWKVVSREDAEK